MKILIVSGGFYTELAEELRKGAMLALDAVGAHYQEVVVPGALEIPQAIRYGIESGEFDGFVALGAVVRGETAHYDVVADESARALMDLALFHQVPIGNGILTTETMAQAEVRAGVDQKNKGKDAVDAVLALIGIKKQLSA